MSTIDISDLSKKVESSQLGRKNQSAKKGLSSFFTPQHTSTASQETSSNDGGSSQQRAKVEEVLLRPPQYTEVEKLKLELDEERKKLEWEKKLFLKEKAELKFNDKETEEIIYPKETYISSPTIHGKEIELQTLFLATSLFIDFTTPEIKFFRCIIDMTNFGKFMDIHIGYDEIKKYGLQSGQLKPLRDKFISLGIIKCRKGRKDQKSKSVEFYTLNSFKYPSFQ